MKQSPATQIVIWENNSPLITGACTIKNQVEFNDFDFSSAEIVYILAELKWDGKKRTGFYGFQIAKELRYKYKVLCPIIFCSFMPAFDKMKYPGAEILYTPGHYLLQLPDKPLPLENYKGIDMDTLEDINFDLLDPNNQMHNLMHDTNGRCPDIVQNLKTNEEKKQGVRGFLSGKLEIFSQKIHPDKKRDFENIKESLFVEIDTIIDKKDFNPDMLINPLDSYRTRFYSCLPVPSFEDIEINGPPKRWQVLFIDDQQYYCESVEGHFKRNNITCLTARSAEQAFGILHNDKREGNKISVIITDFRLYINGDESLKWQDLQGYNILKQIHADLELNSHYAFLILTYKKGTIQEQIKKRYRFPILWFNKADVLGGGNPSFNLFCQRISDVGSEAFFRKHSIPFLGGWKNAIPGKVDLAFNYSHLYKFHLEDIYHDLSEYKINELTIKYTASDEFPEGFTLQPSFKKFDNPIEMLNKFRSTILLYRRIFINLKYLNQKTDKQIFTFFNPKYKPSSQLKINKNENINSNRRDLSIEELEEQQRNEYIKGLFNVNWGFQLEIEKYKQQDDLIIDHSLLLLEEEQSFLKNSGYEFKSFELDDETEILCFLDEISSMDLEESLKKTIIAIRTGLNHGNPVSYSEISNLFGKIHSGILGNNLQISQVFNSTLITYMNDEEFISDRLAEMIKNKLLPSEV